MAAKTKAPDRPTRRLEIVALASFAVAVLLLLALVSFDDRDIVPGTGDTANLIGPAGAVLAHGLYAALGYAAYVVVGLLVLAGFVALARPSLGWREGVGLGVLLPTLAILLHLALSGDPQDVAGGALGAVLGEGLRGILHNTGAWILVLSLLLFAALISTRLSLITIGRGARRGGIAAAQWAQVRAARWKRRQEARRAERAARAKESPEAREAAELEDQVNRAVHRKTRTREAGHPPVTPISAPSHDTTEVAESPESEDCATMPDAHTEALVAPEPKPKQPAAERSPRKKAPTEADGPRIVESRPRETIEETTEALQGQFQFPSVTRSWEHPPLSLLAYDESTQVTFDRDDLMRSAERLVKALGDFKVEGRVVEIHPGPVITMFEFEPAAGTKVRQIQGLEDDLALALQALKVRIAPIRGKGVLGIEVANRDREIVYLKEIVGSERFRRGSAKLPMALGKDISGKPVVEDLAKMPHLLVAGTTGSGKSVGLNTMLLSILYTKTPEEVRIILVDQKSTEFGPYEKVPHLLLPVVMDPKRAAVALRWGVEEMERRYSLMSELGVRNIATYNKKVEQMEARGDFVEEPKDDDGDAAPNETERPSKLPYILIMVDELADLMMVAPREVEASLQRLAQMARASGIHLVIATQRPSVDVVSGVIRANFPARIAYQTRTRTDSRTILDDGGAEQLLGQGDMLLLPPGTSTLSRVHGAYVSDSEVELICDFWREQGKPDYDETILQARDDESAAPEEDFFDELYDQAVAYVAETREVSISKLQRRLRVGYNRAARMVERMERDGIVSPADGTKPREVYVHGIDADGGITAAPF